MSNNEVFEMKYICFFFFMGTIEDQSPPAPKSVDQALGVVYILIPSLVRFDLD